MSEASRRTAGWLVPNVLFLGLVSLLTDSATEMAMPLLPLYLTSVLGAGALALGWIEGLADFTANVLKLFSGQWADRLGRNRPLVLAGYTCSSVARPFLALTTAVWQVVAVRVADRVGKGLRSSPRDSLIAASVPERHWGAAFGLHRAMDHAGAVVGPLLATGFLLYVSRDLRLLFWLTAIPGALAVAMILLGVREGPPALAGGADGPPDAGPASFRGEVRFLVPLGLFTLGNASDLFLLLKAGAVRAPVETLPLLWMGLHVVKALVSLPAGRLADRWGRRRVIALGWLMYAAIYTGFAFAETRTAVWTLFVVYGAHHGLTEGPEKALVAELAPPRRRGTAFGWYHFTLGLLTLAANLLFGALWEGVSSRAAFLAGAALALLAIPALAVLAPRGPPRDEGGPADA